MANPVSKVTENIFDKYMISIKKVVFDKCSEEINIAN